MIPQLGERLECLDVGPAEGPHPDRARQEPGRACRRQACDAAKLLRRFRPNLVLGVGGYAAGPDGRRRGALGIPTALLEQNAHVGLTNRLLARLVDRAYLSFEETAALLPERARARGRQPDPAQLRRAAGNMARMDPAGFEMRARTRARDRRLAGRARAQPARARGAGAAPALASKGVRDRAPDRPRDVRRGARAATSSSARGHGDAVHRRHGRAPTRRPPWSSGAPARPRSPRSAPSAGRPS